MTDTETLRKLEWESLGADYWRAPAPLFGSIRIEPWGDLGFQVLWSVPGVCDRLLADLFDSPEAAKAAAQAACEARILAALTPSPEAQAEPVETLAKDASEEDAINYHVKQAVNSLWPVFGGNHMEAEFWEGLSQLMRGIVSSENPAQFLRDRSEPYHPPAPQPEAPAAQEWHREDNDHSILLYTLKEDRLRNGKPIMVNDLTIRIENANRSTNDLSVVTDAIIAALSAAGRKEQDQ